MNALTHLPETLHTYKAPNCLLEKVNIIINVCFVHILYGFELWEKCNFNKTAIFDALYLGKQNS